MPERDPDLLAKLKAGKPLNRHRDSGLTKALEAQLKRTELAAEAPAPKTQALIAELGPEPTEAALDAWKDRLNGVPIVDIAHNMGCSIKAAKALLTEVHEALREDLKANLELNRELDLQRIDSLLATYLRPAKEGDIDAARLVLKAVQARADLVGTAAPKQPHNAQGPQNVLVWIQNQLPTINQIVDALPPG